MMPERKPQPYKDLKSGKRVPRCQQMQVPVQGMSFTRFHQCRNTAVVDGRWCRVHDPEAIKRKSDEAEARWKEQRRANKVRVWGPRFKKALEDIAAGHNDARGLARDLLEEFDR